MALEVLATSDQYGAAVVEVGFWDMVSALWQIVTSRGDLSVLAQYANPVIAQIEESQPEGTPMQLEIQGLTIGGTDYAPWVANKINYLWQQGYLVEPSGEPLTPWPEYPYQIAWGEDGTVTLRWVKMFVWGAILIVIAIVVAIAAYAAAPYITGWVRWMLSRVPPPPVPSGCEDKTGISRWWCERTTAEKVAIIGSFTVVGAFAVWYLTSRSLAEARAPQIVIVPGGS